MKPTQDTIVDTPQSSHTDTSESPRLNVLKTYKLYIGGKFPRTESGRHYKLEADGEVLANLCLASRKDFRNAVVAARAAQPGWAKASAFLRSQILYRVAEMLEGRASQFASELVQMGADPSEARAEVTAAIDTLVHYAGWADKYTQVFSSVNPVASSHFNFSLPGPTGVVGVVAPEASGLLGLVSVVAPAIVGGNSVVVLASRTKALCAVTLAEVLHTSDLPGGVVNLLTGDRGELLEHFGSHMDVNAVVYCGGDTEETGSLQTAAAENVKRVIVRADDAALAPSPYAILDTQELKTTWHPIGQ
ncbi:MAG: aldehyde dehydrogenase family protein [Planctomycetota bacterium]